MRLGMESVSQLLGYERKNDMSLTKEKFLQIIRKHLIRQIPRDIEIQDGIPEDCNIYGLSKDEPAWTAWMPSEETLTGPSRIICVSKKTGRIIYDGFTNEE